MSSCDGGSANCHFTCPKGGTWFVCENAPYFVGCCSSDPCTNTNTSDPCPSPSLHQASFNTSLYNSISPNNCIGNTSSNWFTCNFTSPPFLGCCKSNPCANDGCPDDDLISAAWSSSARGQLDLFLDAASPTNSTDSGSSSDLSSGAIAGIVVGSVAGVAIIAAVFFLLKRRRHKSPTAVDGMRPTSGEYRDVSSPYQDSHFSSPDPKHPSGHSSGVPPPYPSPLLSEGHRPISEIGSSNSEQIRPNQGLNINYTPMDSQPIHELDNNQAEMHELDSFSRR